MHALNSVASGPASLTTNRSEPYSSADDSTLEWLNLVVRESWQYTPEMPVVPLLDVGLSPLLQWLLLPPLGLWFARRATSNAAT